MLCYTYLWETDREENNVIYGYQCIFLFQIVDENIIMYIKLNYLVLFRLLLLRIWKSCDFWDGVNCTKYFLRGKRNFG